MQDRVGPRDDLLDRRPAHGAAVVLLDLAEVDVHAEQVAALARDEQDVAAVVRLDRALGAEVGEVGVGQDVHDAPRVHRLLPDELAADASRTPLRAPSPPSDILGAHGALLAVAGAAVPAHLTTTGCSPGSSSRTSRSRNSMP